MTSNKSLTSFKRSDKKSCRVCSCQPRSHEVRAGNTCHTVPVHNINYGGYSLAEVEDLAGLSLRNPVRIEVATQEESRACVSPLFHAIVSKYVAQLSVV